MELLATAGRTLAFSLAAGVNLYATVAMLGLAARFDLVSLPPQFAVFDNTWIIVVALVLYVVEFVADKVPWVDTLWDAVHTVVRPLGGALVAVTTLGDASPWLQGLIAVTGGTLAAGGHFTKAGTRAAVNVSPEPFSNWVISLAEDAFVVGLGLLALNFPLAALAVTVVCVLIIGLLARKLLRWIRRAAAPASPDDLRLPPASTPV
jgi:hypothetical protein